MKLAFICMQAVVLMVVTTTHLTIAYSEPQIVSLNNDQAFSRSTDELAPDARRFASSNDHPSKCAANCDDEMRNMTRRDISWVAPDTMPPDEYAIATITFGSAMEKLCRIYNATESCLTQCPNSDYKSVLIKKYAVRKYTCHESTFVRNADCMNGVMVENRIENCTQCKGLAEKSMEFWTRPPSTAQGLKNMMINMCQAMKCYIDCIKSPLRRKCGQAAVNDWVGYLKKYVEYRKNDFETRGLTNVYPSECNQVRARMK